MLLGLNYFVLLDRTKSNSSESLFEGNSAKTLANRIWPASITLSMNSTVAQWLLRPSMSKLELATQGLRRAIYLQTISGAFSLAIRLILVS